MISVVTRVERGWMMRACLVNREKNCAQRIPKKYPLQADKKGHDHRKHRQEEFIDDPGESAREGNHCVQ